MIPAIVVALVAALVAHHARTPEARRRLAIVAAVALGVRFIAIAIVYSVATRTHGEGTWLNDEASFYLAAESLMPHPLTNQLPLGLGHLGNNGYLGLLTAISFVLGRMDTVAFRLTNALFGTCVAMLVCVVADRLIGKRSALIAGLTVALWPTLILWSATFLRDTLASFVIMAVWWTLATHRSWLRPRVLATVALAVILLGGLRPYLAGSVVLGALGWAIYPWLAARSRRQLGLLAVAACVVGVGVTLQQATRIDQAAHELVYRQMTTRMETLGLLYQDMSDDLPPYDPAFPPGTPIALVNSSTGWLQPGLVQKPVGPGVVDIALTDGSIQTHPTTDLVLLQSAPLLPLQMLASLGPGVAAFITGVGVSSDATGPVWMADALAWDVLFLLAIVGGFRARVHARQWLFPACVVLGTVAALVGVPGAPGNDDRHRASHAVPVLVVFAAGLLVARSRSASASASPVPVNTATRMPSAPTAPATSRERSLRVPN